MADNSASFAKIARLVAKFKSLLGFYFSFLVLPIEVHALKRKLDLAASATGFGSGYG